MEAFRGAGFALRFQAVIERLIFGGALRRADHAHAHLVIVAPPVETFFVIVEARALAGFRVDHIDGDMHMGVRRVGVLDDDGLVLLQAQKLRASCA